MDGMFRIGNVASEKGASAADRIFVSLLYIYIGLQWPGHLATAGQREIAEEGLGEDDEHVVKHKRSPCACP